MKQRVKQIEAALHEKFEMESELREIEEKGERVDIVERTELGSDTTSPKRSVLHKYADVYEDKIVLIYFNI